MTTMRQRKRRLPRRGVHDRPLRVKSKSIFDMAGIITPRRGKHVSIEDMNPWR
jgi:hypothetical protein